MIDDFEHVYNSVGYIHYDGDVFQYGGKIWICTLDHVVEATEILQPKNELTEDKYDL